MRHVFKAKVRWITAIIAYYENYYARDNRDMWQDMFWPRGVVATAPLFMTTTPIITARLRLERPTMRDAWLMYRTFKRPGFTDGMYYDGPVSLWFAVRSVLRAPSTSFSIRFNGKPIGRVWLKKREGAWHLGYWMHPAFQGKRLTQESVNALLSALKETHGVIHAEAHQWNHASKKILMNAGFEKFKDDEKTYWRL